MRTADFPRKEAAVRVTEAISVLFCKEQFRPAILIMLLRLRLGMQ
jgi:hypothetical protein